MIGGRGAGFAASMEGLSGGLGTDPPIFPGIDNTTVERIKKLMSEAVADGISAGGDDLMKKVDAKIGTAMTVQVVASAVTALAAVVIMVAVLSDK